MKASVKVYNEMPITNPGIFRKVTNHTFNMKNDSVENKLYIQQVNTVVFCENKN